jgi:DNA end-binding protein Ku
MARSIWTGAINFGLVSVPVKLYSAVSPKGVSFHQVDEKSGSRIRYKRVSEKTGREIPYEQIRKGYELGDDKYVVLDPEELEALEPEKTQTIDIEDFVDLEQIDPIYYEHTYFLAPGKGGEKAYALLRKAMDDAQKVGIGKVVIRTKEYLAAIRPYEKALALETMYFADEVVSLSQIDGIPERTKLSDQELRMAKQLIGSLASDFEPAKYRDEYRKRVLDLIKRKSKGETITIEEHAEETPKVVDLIDALKASVERSGGSAKKTTRKRRAQGSRKKSA